MTVENPQTRMISGNFCELNNFWIVEKNYIDKRMNIRYCTNCKEQIFQRIEVNRNNYQEDNNG